LLFKAAETGSFDNRKAAIDQIPIVLYSLTCANEPKPCLHQMKPLLLFAFHGAGVGHALTLRSISQIFVGFAHEPLWAAASGDAFCLILGSVATWL
jgi:hypothetical protein